MRGAQMNNCTNFRCEKIIEQQQQILSVESVSEHRSEPSIPCIKCEGSGDGDWRLRVPADDNGRSSDEHRCKCKKKKMMTLEPRSRIAARAAATYDWQWRPIGRIRFLCWFSGRVGILERVHGQWRPLVTFLVRCRYSVWSVDAVRRVLNVRRPRGHGVRLICRSRNLQIFSTTNRTL